MADAIISDQAWAAADEAIETHSPVLIQRSTPSAVAATVACIVTCHAAYLPYLRQQIESIDAQTMPYTERVLVLDDCPAPGWMANRPGWTTLRGCWHDPNPARNAGIAATTSEWLTFHDADNWHGIDSYCRVITAKATAAAPQVGILYPDIVYADNQRRMVREFRPRTYDYWELRKRNYISGSGAWRRSLLDEIGGWQATRCYDDWAIALLATARGWRADQLGAQVWVRENGNPHRCQDPTAELPTKWDHRTYAIVTLLAGRSDCLAAWAVWLATADLPPRTSLYLVDDSGDPAFRELAGAAIAPAASRFTHIDWQQAPPSPYDRTDPWYVQRHVAALYDLVLPRIGEDLVFLLEDDVIPPRHALRTLVGSYQVRRQIGAIGGIYESRRAPGYAVAARNCDYDRSRLRLCDIHTTGLIRVGCLGCGATLYRNEYLRQALPMLFGRVNTKPTGFDTYLSNRLTELGCGLYVHAGVPCAHRFKRQEAAST